MHVGDTISVADLIAAWRDGLRPKDAAPGAVARRRIAEASFGVDLSADPPALKRTWTPDWVGDTQAFQHDRHLHRDLLARIARKWAALPADADPFEGFIEAPLVICALYERHATGRPRGRNRCSADRARCNAVEPRSFLDRARHDSRGLPDGARRPDRQELPTR